MCHRVINPEKACGHGRHEMQKCRRLYKAFQSCGLCGKKQLWPFSVLKCNICSFKAHKKCADQYFERNSAGDGVHAVAPVPALQYPTVGGQFGYSRVSVVRRPSSCSTTSCSAVPVVRGIPAPEVAAAFFRAAAAAAVHASLGELPVVHRLGLVPEAPKHLSIVFRTALIPESDDYWPMSWPQMIHSPMAVVVKIRRAVDAVVVPSGKRVRLMPWSFGYAEPVRRRRTAVAGLIGVEMYFRRDFEALARRLAKIKIV